MFGFIKKEDPHEAVIKKANSSLRTIIKKAKSIGVPEPVLRFLEIYDSFATDSDRMPAELNNGASEEEIIAFEATLHIRLPEEYREFLKFFNGARFYEACVNICGVSKDESKYSLYEENTVSSREALTVGEDALPNSFIVIGTDDSGSVICMDVFRGSVFVWDIDFCECYKVGESFFEYIEKELSGYIQWKKMTDKALDNVEELYWIKNMHAIWHVNEKEN
ncbi:MAG: SMI1/KNR4 family protein [Clostridia bacterium]|nr:SMI1/KNR4 family protein [Clostridia bacterium]